MIGHEESVSTWFNAWWLGVRRTWQRLIDGHCGITSIKDRGPLFATLPSQVAAVVPEGLRVDGNWNVKEHIAPGVRLEADSWAMPLTSPG